MKKLLYLLPLVLLLSCHSGKRGGANHSIAKLPAVQVLSLDSSKMINIKEFSSGAPVVLIYFSTTCPHCRAEINMLVKNIQALKGVQIYMITSSPGADLQAFNTRNNLGEFKNIMVGNDYDSSFFKLFKPDVIPFIAVYNRKEQLKKIYIGETSINSISDAVRD